MRNDAKCAKIERQYIIREKVACNYMYKHIANNKDLNASTT
ncbi:hypothetical protein LDG_8496 [Legionella drancourtii LLAP12]|uniref:Uncharacterized protein n=1 Tax=Legionella drancourtii LLAP12 TaxID=658187 RepID=G9ET67_9GAMM|nr:hypothetical protein LDG_8496 [Legionella drancourtii LLAP12]